MIGLVRLLIRSDESDSFILAELLDLSHSKLEIILVGNVDPILFLVLDLYDRLGNVLLSGEGGEGILELLEVCWSLDALNIIIALLAS